MPKLRYCLTARDRVISHQHERDDVGIGRLDLGEGWTEITDAERHKFDPASEPPRASSPAFNCSVLPRGQI